MKKQHFQTIFKTGTAIFFMRYSIDRLWDKEPTKRNSQYYYGGEYGIRTADAVRGIKR